MSVPDMATATVSAFLVAPAHRMRHRLPTADEIQYRVWRRQDMGHEEMATDTLWMAKYWPALLLAVRQTEHKQFLAHRRSVAHEVSVSRSSEVPGPGPVPSGVVMVSRHPESPVFEVTTTDEDTPTGGDDGEENTSTGGEEDGTVVAVQKTLPLLEDTSGRNAKRARKL